MVLIPVFAGPVCGRWILFPTVSYEYNPGKQWRSAGNPGFPKYRKGLVPLAHPTMITAQILPDRSFG
jgi:hypothetical protein